MAKEEEHFFDKMTLKLKTVKAYVQIQDGSQ